VLPSLEREDDVAVEDQAAVLVLRAQREGQLVVAADDDRAVRERVGRDRGDDDRPHVGGQDRAAERERVGRRADRAGHDHAVGAVLRGVASVDRHVELHEARGHALLDGGVVEGVVDRVGVAAARASRSAAACAARPRGRAPGAPRASPTSSSVNSARKPSLPRLIPSVGTCRSPSARAVESMVPSPPTATTRSAVAAVSSRSARRRGPTTERRAAVGDPPATT
jgi:hypothetical protein